MQVRVDLRQRAREERSVGADRVAREGRLPSGRNVLGEVRHDLRLSILERHALRQLVEQAA